MVLAFAMLLYFFKLDKVPAGFYVDEASPAYNAYSLLQTGKDEYGKSFPILFRSLGLYLTPAYTYLSILPIKLFGLSIFSARFVAVVSGLLSAIVVFVFVKCLHFVKHTYTALVTTLFFVITPWIFFYSRIGYEISLSYLFISLTALLLWQALKNPKYLVGALIVGSLSTYSGFMPRYLIPLFFLAYVIVFKSQILLPKNKKYVLLGLAGALVIQIPHLLIFNTPAFLLKSDLIGTGQITSQASKLSFIFIYPLNYVFAFVREFLANYIGYFSLKSLFFLPDPDLQRSIPDLAVFYSWMLPLFLYGVFSLFKAEDGNFKKFVLLMILVFPIPASFTKDPFATHRAIALLLPFMLIMALAVDKLLSKFAIKALATIGLIVGGSLILLWRSYFVLYAHERASVSGFGYSILAENISLKSDHFVIDQSRIKPAYILLAFFNKLPSNQVQSSVDPVIKENYYRDVIFNDRYSLANFETRNINWESDIYKDQILVGDRFAISESQAREHFLTKEFDIKNPLNEIVFSGYRTDPDKKCANTGSESIYCNR